MGRGKSRQSLDLIEAAREILEEIQPASVRAVCYRLFVMGLIPSMEKINTNRVSTQLKYARRQGIIPWEHIVDETRQAEYGGGWENPEHLMRWAKQDYRRHAWITQPRRVELWSEKGTVRGILGPVLDEYQVTFRPMHGHSSETELHNVVEEQQDEDRPLVALYVGDYDPSGMDMSERDAPRRLLELSEPEGPVEDLRSLQQDRLKGRLYSFTAIDLRRLALTEDDTEDGLPSFPASDKRKDTRYPWFLRNYGDTCWELDALSPVTLRERVEEAIRKEIDWTAWERCRLGEAAEQRALTTVLGKWSRAISRQTSEYGDAR